MEIVEGGGAGGSPASGVRSDVPDRALGFVPGRGGSSIGSVVREAQGLDGRALPDLGLGGSRGVESAARRSSRWGWSRTSRAGGGSPTLTAAAWGEGGGGEALRNQGEQGGPSMVEDEHDVAQMGLGVSVPIPVTTFDSHCEYDGVALTPVPATGQLGEEMAASTRLDMITPHCCSHGERGIAPAGHINASDLVVPAPGGSREIEAGPCPVMPASEGRDRGGTAGGGVGHPTVASGSQSDKSSSSDAGDSSGRGPQTSAWFRPMLVPFEPEDLDQWDSDANTLAVLDDDETRGIVSGMEEALVGRLFGEIIPFHIVVSHLHRKWDMFGDFQAIIVRSDWFICIFEDVEARDQILLGGPWFIAGHIVGLVKWTPQFCPDNVQVLLSPVWVRLPELPLMYWCRKNIGIIAAKMGHPIGVDHQTECWGRSTYARVCIRMNLMAPMPAGVWVKGLFGKFYQKVAYEGISLMCYVCGMVDHTGPNCKLSPALIAPLGTVATETDVGPQHLQATDNPNSSRTSATLQTMVEEGSGEPWMMGPPRQVSKGKAQVSNWTARESVPDGTAICWTRGALGGRKERKRLVSALGTTSGVPGSPPCKIRSGVRLVLGEGDAPPETGQ